MKIRVWYENDNKRLLIGASVQVDDGYRFIPKMPHRRRSSKLWSDPYKAIPKWAKTFAGKSTVFEEIIT